MGSALRRVFLCMSLLALCASPLRAAETLADIRQDMSVLYVELQKLKRELNTTGSPQIALPPGALDRIDAIEAELQRLTAKTEELEFRIARVAEDGGQRIGDLEFRLCELEPACDIATLGKGTTLGGEAGGGGTTPAPQPDAGGSGGSELAVAEERDFGRAREALAQGDFQSAADQFATFRETYPGGPLEPQALLGEGRALEGLGDTREAARRYLDTYAGYPESDAAPEALWRLGAALGTLGKTDEACVTLREVGARYPGTEAASQAQDVMARLSCQ